MKYLRYILFAFLIGGLISRAWIQKDVLFYDWDEGIYAEVASGLVEDGGLQTKFNGEVWFNKPPLSHYLISIAFRLIPDPELAARMVMVVFAGILLVLLYMLTKKVLEHFFASGLEKMALWERELVVFIPLFALASAPIFYERATQLNTDAMLGVFWLGYFLHLNSFGLRLVNITLATWAKSLLGLYPIAFEILRVRSITKKGIVQACALFFLPLSWHIVNYLRYGDYFIKSHLMDQLVKRVTDPIELHYGGKLFYVELALKNFSVLFFIMIIAYAWIAWDAYKKHKTPLAMWKSKDWDYYLIMFSALPFCVFLSLVQSKITWYFATVAPLLTISLPYLYMKVKDSRIRYVGLALLVVYSLWYFVPATYAYKPTGDNRTDLVRVAECLAYQKGDSVSILVNAQERQNRNVLEAAQQQTETSFIYGGSPSFVYYTRKQVQYFYKPEEFRKDMVSAPLLVVSKVDRENGEYGWLREQLVGKVPLPECFAGEWEVYTSF